MKHKLQLKNLALSLVLALAMVFSAFAMLPGMAQKAHAESASGKYQLIYSSQPGAGPFMSGVVTSPHTISCNSDGTDVLDHTIKRLLYNNPRAEGNCVAEAPMVTGNNAVTAGLDGNGNQYITVSERFEGSVTVTGKYSNGTETRDYSFALRCEDYIPVQSVSLSPNTAQTIAKGEAVKFTATSTPENATMSDVRCSVGGSNKDAVKLYHDQACTFPVSEHDPIPANGLNPIYAKGMTTGTATLTITSIDDDTLSATCDITVTAGQQYNINKQDMTNGSVTAKVNGSEVTKAESGDIVTLAVTPAEGYKLKDLEVLYLKMSPQDITTVTEGKEYTFVMPEGEVDVQATFEKKPLEVKFDVGAGHESLLGGEMLDYIKSKMKVKSATLDGSIVTLVGVNPEACESDIRYAIWETIFSWNDDRMHNGEMFYDVGYKSFDKYATYQEFYEDTYADEEHDRTPISDGKTYYVLWRKPLDKLELGTGDPVCGKATEDVKPTVPEGVKINFSRWYEGKAYIERFEGGKEYTGFIVPEIDIEGVLWKYFIDPEKTEVSVKGGKEVKKEEGEDFAVSFKATAEHDWDEGTVTKEPTETAEGVKTFKCKHCSATKTEAIPKKGSQAKPAAPKVTTVASTSARAMTVKWTMKWGKVNGAKSYKVAYRKVGSKKWTYKKTKKTKYVVRGHKMRGLYEYKVAAVSKKGTTWSGTSRRYFSRVSDKAKAGKGSIKVSWKKDKTATGYQVLVATNKGMKNYKKFEVGKSAKSYKITGLKKGKKYYVRVRPMKTHGGVTYKGILSKTIKVRVK